MLVVFKWDDSEAILTFNLSLPIDVSKQVNTYFSVQYTQFLQELAIELITLSVF